MRAKKIWVLMSILALLSAMLFAEGTDATSHTGLVLPDSGGDILPGLGQGLSLLDPQRLQMSQSYSLMYSSQGKSGDLVGLYQNWLSYRFSPRLQVGVNLGYFHRPMAALSHNAAIRNQALLTTFQLDYKPFDNLFIHFNFRSQPMIDYRHSPGRF
jgi:hypothetical protein